MKTVRIVLIALVALSFSATALAGDAPATKKTFQQEIKFQIELMKKGDVEKLKFRFTERQRKKITKKMIEKAVKEVGNYSIDELVHKVEPGKYKGQLTAKIKMKNGRTLTTFVLVDGEWQADTLWFK
jgi:hypothetical protein